MERFIRVSSLSLFVFCTMNVLSAAETRVVSTIQDALTQLTLNERELGGEINRRILDIIRKNYLVIDVDGDWLDKFRNREARKDRSSWYFGIGKVIDAGSLFTQYTSDERVAARTAYLVNELRKSRDPDGYLGFWQVEAEGRQNHINWILHEQEYIILGLVRNFLCTGNPQALEDAKIMADYVTRTFPTPQNPCFPPQNICTAGLPEGFLALYAVTGDKRYLDFAADTPHGSQWEIQLGTLRDWKQDLNTRPCHVYVMLARTYAQTELYRLDGADSLLDMSRLMKQELLEKGRGGMLVTGSCSEGEHFTYNQNGAGAIGESCVTAYMLRWIDSLLRLEGDLHYGDIIERTMYNALFAAQSPDGRRIRYFTPFTGERAYDSRDSFCCCGNFRRAMGELPKKVYYQTRDGGIVLNLFTQSQKTFHVNNKTVTLQQETDYPNSGNVRLTFQPSEPLAFAFRFRTPRWCETMTVQLNEEPPITVDPSQQKHGWYELDRTWNAGDTVRITMPMEWRLVRGRAMQKGRVALLRGPVVYCLGKDQNPERLATSPDFGTLVIDPASLGTPIADTTIRPDGLKVVAKAWTNRELTGEQVDVVFTEFADPSGIATYVFVPDMTNTHGVRIMNDEIISEARTCVDAEVVEALYGPKADNIEDAFTLTGTVVASLAGDYVAPEGNTQLAAEFNDSSGSGRWSIWHCRNNGFLSTATEADKKLLKSQFKAYASPLGAAYGYEGTADGLGFVSNYQPAPNMEALWTAHYTEQVFDFVIPLSERNDYLLTHPLADVDSFLVFRWTPGAHLAGKWLTLCGTLRSRLDGNGVSMNVVNWTGRQTSGILKTLDTQQGRRTSMPNTGTQEFTIRLQPNEAREHIDFVIHNNGNHFCDSTAVKLNIYASDKGTDQIDVTETIRSVFKRKPITELGEYDTLFGKSSAGAERTLKLKFHFPTDGTTTYLQLPEDAPIELNLDE
ncbi:MAG: beta-L-arabinofuranosidase domain-containing protein [Pirellulaceae bacterium]